MRLRLLIMLIVAFVLSGCGSGKKCVRVAYYDYGDNGTFQHLYQFKGTYTPYRFWIYDGIVTVGAYLGEGTRSMFEQCADPAVLDGHYPVLIDEGQGTWVLNGRGFGGSIDIMPNSIPHKFLAKVLKEAR